MNKIKEFFKKNWKLVSIISAAVVAVTVTVVLCVCLIPRDDEPTVPVKTAFSTPTNVRVDDDILSWNAVEGANGYTVKIGVDETTTVTTASLDLTTVTAKLSEGENKLSVKVNATADHTASEYSAEVTYNYTVPTPPPAKTPFAAPANLKVEENILKWDAVTGATEYTVKIGDNTKVVNTNSLDLDDVVDLLVEGENKISVKANAKGDKLDSPYTAEITHNYTALAPELPAFDKPTGLSVDEETLVLTWNAVEGATSYTVKIGTATVTVNEASCDLLASGKLTPGENKVSVKVDATDDHKESEYSDEETCNYTPAAEAMAEEYIALVGAIKDITLDSTKIEAEAAGAAIELAENYYSKMTAGKDLDAVKEALESFNTKKSNYETVLTKAEEAHEPFAEALAAALTEAGKEESYNALTEKIGAVDGVYDELATLVKETQITEEETADYKHLKTTAAAWDTAIKAATAAWAEVEIGELMDDESAEAIIAALDDIVADYEDCKAYVKAEIGYDEAATALTDAKEQIETTVDAIKTAAEAALENTELTQANYDALEAQKTALEGVTGAYASKYLASLVGEDDLLTAVTGAMNTMLATVVDSKDGEAYSLTGLTLKVTLFRAFYNFKGDKIATTSGENAPKLSVTGTNVTVEQDFVKNDIDEYIAIINIQNLNEMGDATYTVKVGSDESEKPLKFGKTLADNPYFTPINEDGTTEAEPPKFKKAIDNGHFNFTFQQSCPAQNYYLDVYNADAVTISGEFVKFSEMPLGTLEITGKSAMTMEEFYRFIANSEIGDMFIDKENPVPVRFMIYGKTVTDEVPAFTALNASVISEAIPLQLVDADKYYTMPTGGSINSDIADDADGTMFMVVYATMQGGLLNKINETLTSAGVKNVELTCDADGNGNFRDYLQMKIEVYDATDPESVLYTAYREIGFRTVTVNDVLTEWAQGYYRENSGATKDIDYNIGIRFSFWAKPDTEITKYFPRAEYLDAKMSGGTYQKAIKLGDYVALPSSTVLASAGDNFEVTRNTVTVNLFKSGDVVGAHLKLYQFEDGVEKNVNYMYLEVDDKNATKLVIYKADENGNKDNNINLNGQQAGESIYNAWVSKAAFKEFITNADYEFNVGGEFDWDDGWRIDSRLILNVNSENKNYFFDSAWKTDYEAPKVEKTPKPTDICQIAVEGNLNMNFCRYGQPSGNGSIFNDKFGVTYIEIEMRLPSTDTTTYTTYKMYLFKDGDHYVLYNSADKSEPSDETIEYYVATTADWITKETFENWVRKAGYGLSDFVSTDTVEFRTKVYHDNTYYTEEADYSGWVKNGVSPDNAAAGQA